LPNRIFDDFCALRPSAVAKARRQSSDPEEEIIVRYLMLVCQDSVPVEAPSAPAGGDVEQWVTTMDGRGLRVTGDALRPEAEAASVRARDGQLQVTEGAFLETKGVLLGFDLLECRDMAEAIQVASAHPLASRCVLEIRPVSAD
jgi:hypothetical protein